jgi:hypothetical protein
MVAKFKTTVPQPPGPVEKPIETVAAGLDSDEVGIVTCRLTTTQQCVLFGGGMAFTYCVAFSTRPGGLRYPCLSFIKGISPARSY